MLNTTNQFKEADCRKRRGQGAKGQKVRKEGRKGERKTVADQGKQQRNSIDATLVRLAHWTVVG